MRLALGLMVLPLLAACTGQPQATPCTDPRPQVCSMEYNPTCGVKADGTVGDYSSPCNACADDQVTGYNVGACPE